MIRLSKSAANEVQRLKSRTSESGAYFRLGVQVGGCSGLSYVLDFDQTVQPTDHLFDSEGIQIAIDAESLNYLDGLTLDYSEDLMGGAFRFHNPKAAKHCDCGTSFSMELKDESEPELGVNPS